MRHRNHLVSASAVALLALPLALTACSGDSRAGGVNEDCTPKHTFDTITEGVLTVSTYTYAPATIVEGDTLDGVEGRLLQTIAEWECLSLKIVEQSAAGVIPAVEAGRADLAAGSWYRTTKRAEVLNLTDPIYTDAMVFVSAGGAVKTVEDLLSVDVGTFEGNLWNEDLQRLLGDRLKIFASESAMFQDLQAGRIDVAVDGAGGATNMVNLMGLSNVSIETPPADERVNATTNPGQICWPNTKSNTALNEALNENIKELRESGEIARLLREFGYPDSAAVVGEPGLL